MTGGGNRFTLNPFPDLVLTPDDRTQLNEIANDLVLEKFAEYQEHLNAQKYVDQRRWKSYQRDGNTTMYLERKPASPLDSKLPALLMVGPLPGTLDENMFGLVSPTLEAMRIKSSYLKDFHAAAVLATIVEPTEMEPFRSLVVKWMEIDIPMASIGLVRNRDYLFLESTGIMRLENGERVGYHLMHSVSFPQTHALPNRVRGKMSFCGMFHQETPDKTDCRGTGVMDPGGDMIRILGVMGLAQATMAGLKYSYCGQMKKLAWLLEQKHQEAREQGIPAAKPECVTCKKPVPHRTFGRASRVCKLCFGTVCTSCKIPKKLSFIAPDLELMQRKVEFCARCLMKATHMDTEEAARVQFVYKHTSSSSIFGSTRYSYDTTHSDSSMSVGEK
uniref:FYVE-type domain-containing protein n=1 Tax=Peronospora matthiolae TaxID=2874970 RepID=A0AAV1TIH4_9STRA